MDHWFVIVTIYALVCRLKVGCDIPGKYRVCLDSDAAEFGGYSRVRLNSVVSSCLFFFRAVYVCLRLTVDAVV